MSGSAERSWLLLLTVSRNASRGREVNPTHNLKASEQNSSPSPQFLCIFVKSADVIKLLFS